MVANQYKIIGLKVHKYNGQILVGSNCEFEKVDKELKMYIFCLRDIKSDKKFELELYVRYDECYSGWCVATFGEHEFNEVDTFGGLTHVPNNINDNSLLIDYDFDMKDFKCKYFSYSYDGGDDFYPCGSVNVNLSLFKSTKRGFDSPPIWIFYGKSNLGKSFIAHKLDDLTIFETDSYDVLPEKIRADVIVIGNKHNYTVDSIKNKVNGKLIKVEFSD